jgi:hypothetical protein
MSSGIEDELQFNLEYRHFLKCLRNMAWGKSNALFMTQRSTEDIDSRAVKDAGNAG